MSRRVDQLALEAVKLDKERQDPQWEKYVDFVEKAKILLQYGETDVYTPADRMLELCKAPPKLVVRMRIVAFSSFTKDPDRSLKDYINELRPLRQIMTALKALHGFSDCHEGMKTPKKVIKAKLLRLFWSPLILEYSVYEALLHEKDPV